MSKAFILILYLFVYCVLSLLKFGGIGNNWDWVFPYFSDQLPNFFINQSLAWTDLNLGTPLTYTSDYFFRFIVYILSLFRLNTEVILSALILMLFATGSFGVFLIALKKLNSLWSFVFGVVAFINPAIFYKLFAGHLNYLASYVVFIYLFYYILFVFQRDLRSAIILGLIFAFVGVQLQFFVFSALVLIIYFIFNREKFNLFYFAIICFVPLLINGFWLANFILGVNDIKKFSNIALGGSFLGNRQLKILNIFNLTFSDATSIERLYDKHYLSFFVVFYILLLVEWLTKSRKDINTIWVSLLLLLFMILGTGFYNRLYVWPISIFFPMFREVGHYAPIIILLVITSIIFTKQNGRIFDVILLSYLVFFILINISAFSQYLPWINFSNIRGEFSGFYEFNKTDNSCFRVLTYPFFDAYGFNSIRTRKIHGYLLNNACWDSFTIFSGKDYIWTPLISDLRTFKDSLHYKLLKNYDIENLIKYNIKYIYDLSDIYESNIENYMSPASYNNDLSLIKNDKEFLNKLLARNPGKLNRINDRILEVKEFLPRIYTDNLSFGKINASKYVLFIDNVNGKQTLEFLENYHKDWKIYINRKPREVSCIRTDETAVDGKYVIECQSLKRYFDVKDLSYLWKEPILDNTHKLILDYANAWTIDPEYIKENFDNSYYIENSDGSIDLELVLYFMPQSYFDLGLIMAVTTLVVCLALLSFDIEKRKKKIRERIKYTA